MASGAQGTKQTRGYFVPLGNLVALSSIMTYTPGSGAGGSYLPGSFALADWNVANGAGNAAPGPLLSSIRAVGAGGLLKDMGKTVVSSNRTFRKVQLVVPNNVVGQGAVGASASTAGPYYTGYIELQSGPSDLLAAAANAAPVAYLPALM